VTLLKLMSGPMMRMRNIGTVVVMSHTLLYSGTGVSKSNVALSVSPSFSSCGHKTVNDTKVISYHYIHSVFLSVLE
jgi:hypothetical protein